MYGEIDPMQYPEDRFVHAQGPVEWYRDLPEELPTPNELYARDGRLKQRYDIEPSGMVSVGRHMPIVEGYDWGEVANKEHGLHSLQAVVNTRGQNYGIATAVVNERQITYITSFGEKPQTGSLIGILSNESETDTTFTVYDTTQNEEGEAMFTVRRTAQGGLHVANESLDAVSVGVGKEIPREERRFSLRSIFNGIKKVIQGEKPVSDRNILSGTMSWMTPSNIIPQNANWMQQNSYNWIAAQPLPQNKS